MNKSEDNKVADFIELMTPEQQSVFWKNRRWMAWISIISLLVILLLGSLGIKIEYGNTLIIVFGCIVIVYYLGNSITDFIQVAAQIRR